MFGQIIWTEIQAHQRSPYRLSTKPMATSKRLKTCHSRNAKAEYSVCSIRMVPAKPRPSNASTACDTPTTAESPYWDYLLRRLSVTPVPPSWLLAAQIVINLAIIVVGFIRLTAVGVAAFGLELPENLPGFLLAYLLTVTSLCPWDFASPRLSGVTRWRTGLGEFSSLRCCFRRPMAAAPTDACRAA